MPSRSDEVVPLKPATQKGGGGFLAGVFCGSDCCRKDARPDTDIILGPAPPMDYPKAEKDPDVQAKASPQSSAIQDTTAEDAFVQAEDVDVDNKSGKSGKTGPSEYTEDGSEWDHEEGEEEELSESEEELDDHDHHIKEEQRSHAKSIAALKESFAPIKANLEANPTRAWKKPEERRGKVQEEDDSEEEYKPPRPTEKQREIEELKKSLGKIPRKDQVNNSQGESSEGVRSSDIKEVFENVSMKTQPGKSVRGPSVKTQTGKAQSAADPKQKRKRRCTIL